MTEPFAVAAPKSNTAAAQRPSTSMPPWLVFAAVAFVTFAAYIPALNGGMLWDDDGHVTKVELRSLDGLRRIWLEIGATQQYYPLLHSFFWLQHQMWGEHVLGYHLVNLALHLTAVWFVYLILRQLQVPGAMFGAAIFALHPVQVETVAWITEQKNTLSAVFYLAAMLSYLHFDTNRQGSTYLLALTLFVLGLLSKTVTATLPAALLVIFWWQRGGLSLWRDVLPPVPFFAFGAVAGVFTAIFERTLIGADGEDFALSFVERGLLAGRVVWFYVGKLLWPTNLMFFYPRWEIDAAHWQQWLYPAAALATLVALWAIRERSRGPLAAALFFVGTLFPVLGFLNVFPFIYSWVADHFQYLASLGIITLFAAGVAHAIQRLPNHMLWIGQAACVALLSLLALLTCRQAGIYSDQTKLYEATLEGNPTSWLVLNNLGYELTKRNDLQGAVERFRESLNCRPDYALAHTNLAGALLALDKPQEALEHYQRVVELKPRDPNSHVNLAGALFNLGRAQEALDQCHQALALNSNSVLAHGNLANFLLGLGRPQEAIEHFQAVLKIRPDFPDAEYHLGLALASSGRTEESVPHFRKAAALKPDDGILQNNLGAALVDSGRPAEAIVPLEQAARLQAEVPAIQCNLARALLQAGRAQDSVAPFEQALRLNPEFTEALANLAEAQAQLQHTTEAVAAAEKALELARRQGRAALVDQLTARLAAFRGDDIKPPTPLPAPALPPTP